MSNGDDVLDNWEEIDEAGLKNKLHKIKEERKLLEPQEQDQLKSSVSSISSASQSTSFTPMKLLQRTKSQDCTVSIQPSKADRPSSSSSSTSATKSPLDDMSTSFQPVMMVLHQPIDEYQSANYTAPISSQTVKILRRPTHLPEQRNNGIRQRQPIKTLQQREQEYAEARLRILGSAKNPEDDFVSSSTAVNNTAGTTTKINGSPKLPISKNVYNNYSQQPYQEQTSKNVQTNNFSSNYNNQRTGWSSVVEGNFSPYNSASTTVRQQQQPESILRLPRGPNGSTGFRMHR